MDSTYEKITVQNPVLCSDVYLHLLMYNPVDALMTSCISDLRSEENTPISFMALPNQAIFF